MFLFLAIDPNNKQEYDSLASEMAEKFVKIIDGVFASLSRDGTRTNEMVYYTRNELNIVLTDIRQNHT